MNVNKKFLVLISVILLTILACLGTCTAQSLETLALERPSPAPSRWTGIIGKYKDKSSQVLILEKGGTLHLQDGRGRLHPLKEKGIGLFQIISPGSGTVRFSSRSDGPVAWCRVDGRKFQREFYDADLGKTFRIKPLAPIGKLREAAMKEKPPSQPAGQEMTDMADLSSIDPAIKLDIRYATSNNFMGEPLYSQARAFLHRPASQGLQRAVQKLKKMGFGVIIYDAYRPWYVTRMFWDATPDNMKNFVADPAKGSRHNRGAAVDLSLYDLKTGRPVEMTGGYDEFSERSYPGFTGGTSLQRWHRDVLRSAMEGEGFKVNKYEWWHFDYKGWENYPVMNLSFEEISKNLGGSK
jgi:D-alanyl-D-alanine dipeptidase